MVAQPQFEVVEPSTGETPVLVEVPHAGLDLDAESLAWTAAPARSIAGDADLHVDALFQDAPAHGATLLTARASRYVVDLNRGEDDCDAEAVEGGGRAPWPRGLIWRLTTEGDPVLVGRLPRHELERRLALIYRPYHATLARLLERKRARFGFAILLCAHSMPSQGRPAVTPGPPPAPISATSAASRTLRSQVTAGTLAASGTLRSQVPTGTPRTPGTAAGGGGGIARADLVPGTRGRTTAAGSVIDLVDRHARERGWSVRHDDPYRGGYATAHYGKPDRGIHAVQIEIARRLYMDETTFRLHDAGFASVREFAGTLVARLAQEKDPSLGLAPRGVTARG